MIEKCWLSDKEGVKKKIQYVRYVQVYILWIQQHAGLQYLV